MNTKSLLMILLAVACMAGCSDPVDTPGTVGYIEADWTYIAAPNAGWLTSLPVTEGTTVARGDILFELDQTDQVARLAEARARLSEAQARARDLESGARQTEIEVLDAQVAEARARLEQAESERDRVLPLVAQNVLSAARGDEVIANANTARAVLARTRREVAAAKQAARPAAQDAALATSNTARATIDSAQYRLEQRTAHAPVDGRIEQTFYKTGEFVTAGAPVLALRASDGLKVRFFVPQDKLSQLSLGKTVNVHVDGRATAIAATVRFIARDAQFTPPVIYSQDARQKLVFLVEADVLAAPDLHPGLPVDIRW